MQTADKPAFLAVLNGLAAVKPGAKLTPEAYDVWWLAFASWSLAEFRSAAGELVKSCEFMPNPYHFEELRRAQRVTAGECWALVRDVVRAGGTTSGDAHTDSVVRVLGGYHALAMTNSDQMPFLERRFCEHFEQMRDAMEVRECLPQLSGGSTLRLELPSTGRVLKALEGATQ